MPRADLSVHDGAISIAAQPTGQDYWSLAAGVDLARHATGRRRRSSRRASYRVVGRNAPRVDLAAKVFGAPVFVHDMTLDGMVHARVVRQPRRGATIASDRRGGDPPRRAKAPIEILRDGNFLAILGADETVVEAAAAVAPGHVAWDGVDPINPSQEEARWLLQQPSIDRIVGAPPPPIRRRRRAGARRPLRGCTSPTPRSRRPARWRVYRDGHLAGVDAYARASTRCARRSPAR